MAKQEDDYISPEDALVKANESVSVGPLAQMGIHIQTPEEISVRMASALLDATTVDDLLAENSTVSWGEHEGRSVLVKDVSYAPSTKKSRLGFYAIVNAVDVDNDKPLLLISGSENVVMQLAKLVKLNALNVPVKLVSNQTGDGNTVHRLVKGDPGEKAPY